MTELLTQYINFMFQGLQEFCVGCVPIGLACMFTRKIKDVSPVYSKRNQGRKRTVGNSQTVQPKKTVARKSRTTQKKKKQKPRPRYTAPPLSREEEAKIDRYRARRDGVKFDDSWSSFGIPL